MKIIILKILFLNLLIYLYIIKFNILIKFKNNDKYFIRDINYFFQNYFNLKNINLNKKFLIKNKYNFRNDFIKNILKKNITKINEIFLSSSCRFGNCIIYLNKYIYYCEILGCNSILLNKKSFWFIKNKNLLKNNLIIKLCNIRQSNKYLKLKFSLKNFFNIKPKIRINLLRNEIIKNLPKIKLSKKDLYIHIRSDDIFIPKKMKKSNGYIQPPLCFYKNILNNFKFRNIHIISSDKGNPVITKLINFKEDIILKKHILKFDISILINAYNLVSSTSSFFISCIQLNYHINSLWDYNIYNFQKKNLFFHYDLYEYPYRRFILYRMEPTKNYKNFIFRWKNNKRQIKLMIKEKCYNNFQIIY